MTVALHIKIQKIVFLYVTLIDGNNAEITLFPPFSIY